MICKYWIELHAEMGLYEYCKLHRRECMCSGTIDFCQCKELYEESKTD